MSTNSVSSKRCEQVGRFRLSLRLVSGALAIAFGVPHLTFAADAVFSPGTSNPASELERPKNGERLSHWLLRQKLSDDAYLTGLSWLVPSEKPAQAALRSALLLHLMGSELAYRADPGARQRLSDWVNTLPVTGRVPVALADARWLQAHPAKNPVLGAEHRVLVPVRPSTVTVVTSDGRLCKVGHSPGNQAKGYVDACSARTVDSQVDHVWIAQPDGRVENVGIASWNQQVQGEPAPGAWIWAPARNAGWSDEFSKIFIDFLATQGPAQDESGSSTGVGMGTSFRGGSVVPSPLARDPVITGNDWGGIGLLQTPTARMAKAGELSVSFSRDYPYSNLNVTLQPFDWMELGYRYTSISGRA